eukprot:scaffold3438_cov141-Isochrysis_galbana.AAC.1
MPCAQQAVTNHWPELRLWHWHGVVPRPYSVGKCVVHDGDLERFPFVSEEWGLAWVVGGVYCPISVRRALRPLRGRFE